MNIKILGHYGEMLQGLMGAIVLLINVLKRLCAPQVVFHTDKLWDFQLVLPPPDLLLLILGERSKSHCLQVSAGC